jgi:xylulokinase
MRENGMNPTVIRAGKSNMFLSSVFTEAFVNATGVPVELFVSDGSVGAALGAGIGAGFFQNSSEAFSQQEQLGVVLPEHAQLFDELYQRWREHLLNTLKSVGDQNLN